MSTAPRFAATYPRLSTDGRKTVDPEGIPQCTLEVLASGFHKEAAAYGFRLQDYLRFVNVLLERAMDGEGAPAPAPASRVHEPRPLRAEMPLDAARVRIRAPRRDEDAPRLERWLGDRAGRHFLVSPATARALDSRALVADPRHILGVTTTPEDRPLGLTAFLDYDPRQRKAELRKLIGEPDMRGRGFGREATALWIAYGIGTLGLRKIVVNTLENNIRNVQINEQLGFKVEGVLRNEVFFDGQYHDVLRMGLWVE